MPQSLLTVDIQCYKKLKDPSVCYLGWLGILVLGRHGASTTEMVKVKPAKTRRMCTTPQCRESLGVQGEQRVPELEQQGQKWCWEALGEMQKMHQKKN